MEVCMRSDFFCSNDDVYLVFAHWASLCPGRVALSHDLPLPR